MAYPTLDKIVRNVLMNERKPMHWYLEYLNHAKDCLRELGFDILKNINTRLLSINSYHAVDLPCNYLDTVKVGIPVGQYVKPLLQYEKISRLTNNDIHGDPIPYPDNDKYTVFSQGINWNLTRINENGEDIGRVYGLGQGREIDTYKIIPERNQIQLNQHLCVTHIVLEWISDGTDCDAATRVNPYAQKTIETYIKWQYKECNRTYGLAERSMSKQQFLEQRDLLISRLSGTTVEDVKRVALRANYAAPKS